MSGAGRAAQDTPWTDALFTAPAPPAADLPSFADGHRIGPMAKRHKKGRKRGVPFTSSAAKACFAKAGSLREYGRCMAADVRKRA